ncbi:MAG: HAD family hydrolase [Xenococcaceae cyanobacterium MO_234.B1]|nr:HAD family hydrolase [Xenococcaceae cyanobacterium MO_234.B1]
MVTICCGVKKFTNIKSILLDKDGTLENSQSFLQDLARERVRLIESQLKPIDNFSESLLSAFGIRDSILGEFDPTGLMAVGSRAENAIAAAAYVAEKGYSWFEAKQIVDYAFEQAQQNCIKTAKSCPLFPSIIEMLQAFSEAGLKLGIVSADSTSEIEIFMKRHQLSDYIHLILGSDRDFSKPDPKLFIQACQMLGVSPAQTIMIGDSLGDIQMAQEAGAAGTIGISWSESWAGHLKTADVEIRNLQEIKIFPSYPNYPILNTIV